jgi:hypothetical protein
MTDDHDSAVAIYEYHPDVIIIRHQGVLYVFADPIYPVAELLYFYEKVLDNSSPARQQNPSLFSATQEGRRRV